MNGKGCRWSLQCDKPISAWADMGPTPTGCVGVGLHIRHTTSSVWPQHPRTNAPLPLNSTKPNMQAAKRLRGISRSQVDEALLQIQSLLPDLAPNLERMRASDW